jgi:hypothetical protein
MLVEEQARDRHPFDGRDMSVEIEGRHAHMDVVEGERTTKTGQLSRLVMGIPNTLVDLGMLPIWDIPYLPKSSQEVLAMTGLILERL